MRMIKEQLISLFKKGFDGMEVGLTEKGQRQRVSDHQKRCGRWRTKKATGGVISFVIIASLFLASTRTAISSTSPSGTYPVGGGVVWVGDSINRTSNDNSLCSNYLYAGQVLTGAVSSGNWGASGGYTGVKLAEDVVLFFNGDITQNNRFTRAWVQALNSTETLFTTTFSETGQYYSNVPDYHLSNMVPNSILNIVPQSYNSTIFNNNIIVTDTNFRLTPSLYVGPNAVPGSYSVNTSIGVVPSCDNGKYTVISTGTINIVAPPPRLCNLTVSPSSITTQGQLQTMNLTNIQSGKIRVTGNCTQGDSSNIGNLQFSILADNPIASNIGGPNSALALLNTNAEKVGSVYFENTTLSPNYLSVVGNKYNVPVQWTDINFATNYSIVDLAPSDTQAFGVGRGTAKFIVEWP